MATPMESPQTHPVWCVLYGMGIIGFLVLYGIFQEGIMTVPYNGSLFTFSVFLVLCNRLAAVIFAVFMAQAKGENMKNQAPVWKYLIVSLSNVYASSCQYEALKYVSFAVQMLGKSFKMMPVMIWGMIISGKSYSMRDWAVAMAVTLGCTEFLMTGPTASKVDTGSSFKGFLYLAGFLLLDGLTSTFQEKLFREHNTTKYNQMMYINLLSACVSAVTLMCTGHMLPAITFGIEHPRFFVDSAFLSGAAVASQWCIYSQIKELGALVFAATMNVRQVLRAHDPRDALAALGQCLCNVETQLVLWALRVATGDELRLLDVRESLEGQLRSPWSSLELRLAQLAALLRLDDTAAVERAAVGMLGAVRRGGEMKEALLQIFFQLGQTRTLPREVLQDIDADLEDVCEAVRLLAMDVLFSQSGPGLELTSHCVAVCLADPSPLVQQKFFENVHRLDTRVVLAAIRSKEDAGEAGALTALKALQKLIAPSMEEDIFQEVILFAAHRCGRVRAKALELLGNDEGLRQRSLDIFNAALSDPSAVVRSSAWHALCLAGGKGMDVDRLWSLPTGEGLEEWLPRARPQWSIRDVAAALEKLKGIEVTTLQQLRDVLKAGRMNDMLERKHFRRFNRATLRAFEEQLFN